jgi:hypothetical protein
MEFTFTPLRVLAFVALLGGFALFGGFVIPPDLVPRQLRLWVLTLLLFVLGAMSATVVDHWVGNLDRSNLRWFYIVAGLCAMALAVVFRQGLGAA